MVFPIRICWLENQRRAIHEKPQHFRQLEVEGFLRCVGKSSRSRAVSIFHYFTKQSSYIIGSALAYYLTTPSPIAGDYTWEKVGTFNIGLDVNVLNNRLNFSADYFIRKTSDMFVDGITLPSVYGANPPRQNAGEMETKGYEITVTWRDKFRLAGQNMNYEIFASLGDATSEITKYQGMIRIFCLITMSDKKSVKSGDIEQEDCSSLMRKLKNTLPK